MYRVYPTTNKIDFQQRADVIMNNHGLTLILVKNTVTVIHFH